MNNYDYPYKTREGGATVTVFVPYDCNNHCPFCVNKCEYADMTGFSAEKICESIDRMNALTPKCDFVFTGGEPFANLQSLQMMLDHIPNSHRIFINTTLPVSKTVTEEDIIRFTRVNQHKISCINISRHIQRYVVESNDALLHRLAVPVRINCVTSLDMKEDELRAYLERFKRAQVPSVQFRFDYTATTPENLYEKDAIFDRLKTVANYTGLDGCRMRCGFHFDYNGLELTYHKTLPYSTMIDIDANGVTYAVLYDILIKQTGQLHSDWDGTVLDFEKYRAVTFEPYDLKVIEQSEIHNRTAWNFETRAEIHTNEKIACMNSSVVIE